VTSGSGHPLTSKPYCRQQPTHPASKKFRKDVAMSAFSRPPRLRAFDRAALSKGRGKCYGKRERRAQDDYLIVAACEAALPHMLGRNLPMLESSAVPI
jgi:hypothetical protein